MGGVKKANKELTALFWTFVINVVSLCLLITMEVRRALTGVPQWVRGIIPQSKRSPVQFQVKALAWVAGLVPHWGACERQLTHVSFSHLFFSSSLSPSRPLL